MVGNGFTMILWSTFREKEGPPESWKDKGNLECRWLGMGELGYCGYLEKKEGPSSQWERKRKDIGIEGRGGRGECSIEI